MPDFDKSCHCSSVSITQHQHCQQAFPVTGLCSGAGGARPCAVSWGWCDGSWGRATEWETLETYEEVNKSVMQEKWRWGGRWMSRRRRISPAVVAVLWSHLLPVLGTPGCVCRMAGQVGTSFNKIPLPPPGWGNAACAMLCMDFDLNSVEAKLALPSPLVWEACEILAISNEKEPENTELAGAETGFSAHQNKDRAIPKAWFSLKQHVIYFLNATAAGKRFNWFWLADTCNHGQPWLLTGICCSALYPCIEERSSNFLGLLFSAVCNSFWSWTDFRRDRLGNLCFWTWIFFYGQMKEMKNVICN